MSSKVFVRNLPWAMAEVGLSEHCGGLGLSVSSVKVILDRDTGRSRGFAFVELSTEAEALRAIDVLTGSIADGRVLSATMARRQEADRPRGDGLVPGQQDPRGADRGRRVADPRSGRSKFQGEERRSKSGRPRSVSRGESSDW